MFRGFTSPASYQLESLIALPLLLTGQALCEHGIELTERDT